MKKSTNTKKATIRYKGRTIQRITNANGKEGYRVDLPAQGSKKRCRPFRSSLAEIKRLIDQKMDDTVRYSAYAQSLTEEQRIDAAKAYNEYLQHCDNITLEELAKAHCEKHGPATCQQQLKDVIEEYLIWVKTTPKKQCHRSSDGYRSDSIPGMKTKLNHLSEALGKKSISTVTSDDIIDWLDSAGYEPKYRNNHRTNASVFWEWCIIRNYAKINIIKGVPRVHEEFKIPEVYTPAQTEELLRTAEQEAPSSIPYLSILFFAGVRPTECRKLTWHNVDFQFRTITIPAKISKSRRTRKIPMSDNLYDWLTHYGHLRKNENIYAFSESTLARQRRRIRKVTGLQWITDGARHSFATYSLSAQDRPRTIEQLGHKGAKMLKDHYEGYVWNRDEASVKYFSILPEADQQKVSALAS